MHTAAARRTRPPNLAPTTLPQLLFPAKLLRRPLRPLLHLEIQFEMEKRPLPAPATCQFPTTCTEAVRRLCHRVNGNMTPSRSNSRNLPEILKCVSFRRLALSDNSALAGQISAPSNRNSAAHVDRLDGGRCRPRRRGILCCRAGGRPDLGGSDGHCAKIFRIRQWHDEFRLWRCRHHLALRVWLFD